MKPHQQRTVELATSSTDPSVLRELSTSRLIAVREAVARNPHTDDEVLLELLGDPHHRPRYGVAENPSRRAIDLVLRAGGEWERAIAARREDLTKDDVESMLRDEAVVVRENLANTSKDLELLTRLARDNAASVRAGVALRRDLVHGDLLQSLAADRSARVRGCVAERRDLPEELMRRLVEDRSVVVRWRLLHAHSDVGFVVDHLLDDPDEENARSARYAKEHPGAFGPEIDLTAPDQSR